jgi:hypothetical protein
MIEIFREEITGSHKVPNIIPLNKDRKKEIHLGVC